MASIAIVTDTDASLPAEVAEQYGIRQVPITIHFGQTTYLTGLDIDDASVFRRVDAEGVLPTTSAPTPGDFLKAFQAAFDGGADEVICLCVSSRVSTTYGSARRAREMLLDRAITVVDTQNISMGQGFMAMAAAEAAAVGAAREEIILRAMDVGSRVSIYGALSTLKYLAMSGRVSHLTAGVASLLSIRPILTLRDGELQMLERVRTQRKAWDRVIQLTAAAVAGGMLERLAIIHVDALDRTRRFEEQLRAELDWTKPIITAELTPGLSVQTGSGLVGVAAVTVS